MFKKWCNTFPIFCKKIPLVLFIFVVLLIICFFHCKLFNVIEGKRNRKRTKGFKKMLSLIKQNQNKIKRNNFQIKQNVSGIKQNKNYLK
jgi:hypothetical protein